MVLSKMFPLNVISLFAALALAGCASVQALPAKEAEMARAFAEQAAYCAKRTDTEHPVFKGCIDWHSSAHAYYALTEYALLTGDKTHDAFIETSLDRKGLDAELADLTARPDFERPYGRAWFLRLYAARKAAGGDDRLKPLAAEIARSLEQSYTSAAADPNSRDYRSATFAMLGLSAYARAEGDRRLHLFVIREVIARWMTPGVRCNFANEPRGFLSTCAAWAWLVAENQTPREFAGWYEHWNPGLETWTPIETPATDHEYGKNFSRAWGLAEIYGVTRDARYRTLYCAHLEKGYAQWSAKRDDYGAVGHWVAQFGMLALERGRANNISC
jgi:Protein of unknown function (DUF2891)